ncbi:hypothetical protein B0H14DRAFT_2585141 [Mycena olivaceomarginata]|nr:hypothetical protein B0H14DRAFT_2585141 [Mycena olivaceomarginata]
MARARIANRYQILSSEADDDPMDDGQLPPSDPPDHSASDSDSDPTTPIQQMPALTSLLGVHADTLNSSPATTKRVYRAPRSSSVPPQESPIAVDMRSEHPVSDDIIFTPRKEKQILRERAEAQRQQSRTLNRTAKVRVPWKWSGRKPSCRRRCRRNWQRKRSGFDNARSSTNF